MTVALILLAALLLVGGILYAFDRIGRSRNLTAATGTQTSGAASGTTGPQSGDSSGDSPGNGPAAGSSDGADDGVCCGMHLTCEKTSLSVTDDTLIYYDDEELDVFAGHDPATYTRAEIEMFRDVLLTLIPSDIAPWARSLQLRHITMPPEVRDELLLIVAEARASRN